ncbi:MAG TPA: M23 family metallopeptidase [Salinivirgaceae bacterium]|nr:M23 family metallopeptidase [Salinivirgaceae bacterium]HQA76446.1 M23 family metallopeptidase [Salinivirgaceae bacterium]
MFFKVLAICHLLLLIIVNSIKSQPYFSNPLDIHQTLSGSFGELRSSNFHSGIDIKTNGAIGHNIYAIADGFVSRINISPFGYGKAIYIDHPNGYTSVYAHLDGFVLQISDYIEREQYEKQSFAVNLFLEPDVMPVKKGDIIGFSGNSGTSMGPHLHFEIRNTRTHKVLDPLNFNFDIVDNIPPRFYNLYFYPFGKNSHIDGETQRIRKHIVRKGNTFRLADNDTIKALNRIGFAAHVNDKVNNSNNICGVVNLIVEVNDIKTFELNIPEISFNEVRYVQSHIDYELFRKRKRLVHKCFIEPGNKFSNYADITGNGYLQVKPTDTLNVKITAYDSYKNRSTIKFVVCGSEQVPENLREQAYIQKFIPNISNIFEDSVLKITTPANALYDTVLFNYSILPKKANTATSVYRIGNPNIPLHKPIEIVLKNLSIPVELSDKVVLIDCSNEKPTSIDTKPTVSNNEVIGKTRVFTDISIAYDTVAPTILPLNIKNNETITSKRSIKIKIIDNLSGINKYDGFIDNQWVLFDYDAKNNLMEYTFDSRFPEGKEHILKISVSDNVGNTSEREIRFIKEMQNE